MNHLHSHNAVALAEVSQELDFISIFVEAHAFSLKTLRPIAPLLDSKSIDRESLERMQKAICVIQSQMAEIDVAIDNLFESLEAADGFVTIQRQARKIPEVCAQPLSTHDQQLHAGDAGAMVTGQDSPPGGT